MCCDIAADKDWIRPCSEMSIQLWLNCDDVEAAYCRVIRCWCLFCSGETASSSVDRLLFHPRCGLHASVINDQCTAHRPQSVMSDLISRFV